MKSTEPIIAICSCHKHFFWNERSIEAMNRHITEDNYKVHQWVYVPDIIITQEMKK